MTHHWPWIEFFSSGGQESWCLSRFSNRLPLPNYMNLGNDKKNRQPTLRVKCERWSRASPLPSAGRPGVQKFSTSPGPQWNSSGPALNSGALQTPFAAPQRPGGGAQTLSSWQTLTAHPAGPASRYSAASWGVRSTGRTRGSPSAGAATGARRRRGPGRAWGRWNREVTSFSGSTAQASFASRLSEPFLISAPPNSR